MSEDLNAAAAMLNEKLDGGFDGVAKFVIEGEGAIMVDQSGARVGDEDAEVTMTADAETFKDMISGDLNPTTAFMTGKLSVDGDMGKAMALGSALS
ncbi:SCP2 sterol-binding domain-containing protein [Pseudooceanicola sp.]|uniref:SCP2 sterol-binding domain-containing protein n=1 Tax=Pseudooceanicola sp. TaxID=1914328 RepID=UPI00405A2D3F